jgi:RNA polymerase sigma factor (sigma-70 family)
MGAHEENDAIIREMTARMSRGDEEAYRTFYEICFDKIYRHLLVRTRGDEGLAQEFTQLVLVRVVRYIQPFSGERVFWAWLYQLCRSTHVDWLRRNGKQLTEEWTVAWEQQTAQGQEDDEELLAHLETSMQALEAQERELLKLAYFEAVPQRAIAERFQSTTKAVESKLARIRQKLRRMILERLKEYAIF